MAEGSITETAKRELRAASATDWFNKGRAMYNQVCKNACKRSYLCVVRIGLLSVPIKPACAEQGR